MTGDARTIAAYDARAADYAARFGMDRPDRSLEDFIRALPPAARVLDLGCGPATASAFLRQAGHRPDPVDASAAMVALANARHDIGARHATFDDIGAGSPYDAVWANFSLLHAARSNLPRHLAAIRHCLVRDGLFHIAMKLGAGEGRDALDRFYAYYGRGELLSLLVQAEFSVVSVREGSERGLAGTDDPFIVVLARG